VSGTPAGRLDLATLKLDRAISQLEVRLSRRLAAASAQAGDLFDADRTRLASDLDVARAREAELVQAAALAAEALDRAIDEIRDALSPRPPGDGDGDGEGDGDEGGLAAQQGE
jgi:hypothetical protein